MFETRDHAGTLIPAIPPDALARFAELRAGLAARSQIVWGEHCSECAFPTCYSSCAFYTPRKDDLNCGRFAGGIQPGWIGEVQLATVTFRKWGKLFGTGPAGLRPRDTAQRLEKAAERDARRVIELAPSLAIRWAEWKSNERKSARSAQGPTDADAFVIEAWLQGEREFSFALTVMPKDVETQGFFQRRLRLGAGYNRLLVSRSDIAERVALDAPYSIQLEPFEDSIGRTVSFGLVDFAKFSRPVAEVRDVKRAAGTGPADGGKAVPAAKSKCIVWDLDNTVWRGTLAEDGIEGLVLDERVKAIIIELDKRGILHSVASKNDPEPALAALEAFGLKEYMLFPQVSWGPKSDAIDRIAQSLDIGIDSLVFIDDQPFERGEVAERFPQVTVLADSEIPHLLARPSLDVPATAESAARRSMYMAEQLRRDTFERSGTDYVAFLRGCNIRVQALPLSSAVLERAFELSQRTNQLNVSGRRYARDELLAMRSPASASEAFLFSCTDRFGEYGIIAMAVVSRRRPHVESFMMSCRVQRKRVEQSIFHWLLQRVAAQGHETLEVSYRKTKRNDAAVRMLEELGFELAPDGADGGTFRRRAAEPIADTDVVTFVDLTAAEGDARVA